MSNEHFFSCGGASLIVHGDNEQSSYSFLNDAIKWISSRIHHDK